MELRVLRFYTIYMIDPSRLIISARDCSLPLPLEIDRSCMSLDRKYFTKTLRLLVFSL